jgi:TRAP-type uncharacterized transport system fused permease subunit
VFVASAIAKSDWLKTGFIATRLGLSGFLIPYMFYFTPSLLLEGDMFHIIQNSVTAALGIIALSAAVMGFLKKPLSLLERIFAIIAGLLFIDPGTLTDILGGIILCYLYFKGRFELSLLKWMRNLGNQR